MTQPKTSISLAIERIIGICMTVSVLTSSVAVRPVSAFFLADAVKAVTSGSVKEDFDGYTIPARAEQKSLFVTVDATAYTSSVEECDDDPFTTADGSTTADGIIATNFLPFNTKIRIPSVFGDRIFEVHDRMNSRYWKRIDVWMSDKDEMRKFGLHKNIQIEIVEMGDGKTRWAEIALANAKKNKK